MNEKKPALAVIARALHRLENDEGDECDDLCHDDSWSQLQSTTVVAALKANGYVIVTTRHNRSSAGCAYSGNGSTRVVTGNVCPICETQGPTP